jgi:hypothetical protein
MQLAKLLKKSEDQLAFFSPSEVRHMGTNGNNAGQLVPHDMPEALKGLRKALGLPESNLILEFQTAGRRTTSGYRQHHLYEYDHTTQKQNLVKDIMWGKSLVMLGYRGHEWDRSNDGYKHTGPVQLTPGYHANEQLPKKPNLSDDIKVKTVTLIDWATEKQHWGNRASYAQELSVMSSCNAVGMEIEFNGVTFWLYLSMKAAEQVFGVYVNETGLIVGTDAPSSKFPDLVNFLKQYNRQGDEIVTEAFGFTMEDLHGLRDFHVGEKSLNNLLKAEASRAKFVSTDSLKKPGLTKLYKTTLAPFAQELFDNGEYLAWMALRSCFANGAKATRKVKGSVVVNHMLGDVTSAKELKTALEPFTANGGTVFSTAIEGTPYFLQKRKETVKKDTGRAIRKRVKDLDEIELDQQKYPLTYEALTEGEIPLTCIFPADETYFLINDNWQLWEDMLRRFPEETKECATEAGARKNYERDLMSYFYFVLHGLPEYLEEQTGYTWTASPRLVQSQYELEPEAVEEDRGVIKKRSALTPVADNKKHHVVVPYCSMAVHGRMTTYCYAHTFNVLSRGMMDDGNVVTKNLEEKLNGKDDYGLMYYTLTGSVTNRGYPTFLIIFERLKSKSKTRVHFHRVHPMRSKMGDANPISNWTKTSYNWMIGNVNVKDIAFQQGDLAFIRVPAKEAAKIDFTGAGTVSDCDSHCFARAVPYLPYEGKKKHVLGHIQINDKRGQKLIHPEHDNVTIREEGVFEVRQCRSWEANPKGVWTLNFD